ncbi:ribosome-binding factor A [Stratiformator vulcanicus]|uniref:Ribosome-binding factor A n=1 Tax=Stratiformator vulcanicus TaxID=2527980 RepID=A0A517R7G1_9PLAN|nr:ribosome-binding factor A [Stratiformator vulcanicus]QDT39826.1 ribosome-binding factor A [Stratiformator vulcanicus]
MRSRRQGAASAGRRDRRPDRKTLQLCQQVKHTLEYVLTGECDDDVLRGLYVESVNPLPDASNLLVTVSSLDRENPPEPADVVERLGIVGGKLRSEVAASISRRKVPELHFTVASEPSDAERGETGYSSEAMDG